MAAARDFIGSYQLVRLLNSGQTCQVWEALSTVDGRRVIVKPLQKAQLNNSEAAAALKQELDVGKSVKHPNVIQVFDFQSDRTGTYLVLELFPGRNLKQYLREGHARLAFLAQKIIHQAAEGLAELHKQGWVHRDIKPDNFLMNPAGDLKLIDFSIAVKARSGGLGFGKLLGLKGKVQGTRSYMSPEQIRAEAVDGRADLYSFGCTIFELLTGRVPFTAANPDELLGKHLKSPPPLASAVNDNVTPEMAALIHRLLAKKKEDRPATLGDFLKDFKTTKLFKTRPKQPDDWAAAPADPPKTA